MRQGNDVGTQYRSGIYIFVGAKAAGRSIARHLSALNAAGYGTITTEMIEARVLLRRKLPSAVPC